MLQLYKCHYLDEDFSWQFLQLLSAWHMSQCPTIQERANVLQAKIFGKSFIPLVKLL